MKTIFVVAFCMITLGLGACSIEISDATPAPAATRPPSFIAVTVTSAEQQVGGSLIPAPTSTPSSVPTLGATRSAPIHRPGAPFTVPVTWANLHLAGKLVYTAGINGIAQLDLNSGTVTYLFRPADPNTSYLIGQAVSPDNKYFVRAWALSSPRRV